MASHTLREAAKDLGKDALAFGTGWGLQVGENVWYSAANQLPAPVLGESPNDFVNYWSPAVSPWNFVGLAAGLVLSVIPKKEGSKARWAARNIGKFMIAAEGWGYAQHNLVIGSGVGGVTLGLAPWTGVRAGTIPRDVVRPQSSFYRQPGVPGTQAGEVVAPKNFF